MRKCVGVLALLILLVAGCGTQGNQAEIQVLLEQFTEANEAPGVGVAILKKGQETPEIYASGFADISKKTPFTADMRIKIGSTTKIFTALQIFKLFEEGKLERTTKLSAFMPEYKYGPDITMENLLTHESGLHEMLMVEPFHSHMDSAWSPADIWKMVEPLELDFEPGSKRVYSNTNFLVLGLIIEQLTGKSYNNEVLTEVMEPLGMTGAMPATEDIPTERFATGYQKELKPPIPASLIPPQATGGIIASAVDLVQLVNAYQILETDPLDADMHSGKLNDGFLNISTIDIGDEHFEQGFGEGWEIDYYFKPSVRIIGKLGQFPGYCSGFYYFPDTETAVAICTNQENAGLAVMVLARTLLTMDMVESGY